MNPAVALALIGTGVWLVRRGDCRCQPAAPAEPVEEAPPDVVPTPAYVPTSPVYTGILAPPPPPPKYN